jgi:Flp pilus assembly protein CpaB
MKNKVTSLIAVVFSVVLLSVVAQAQSGVKPVADTGMLTLGSNQVLRVTVATGDVTGDDVISVRFRQMEYMEQGDIYRVASSNTSAPITLTSGEATSIDIPNTGSPVRGVVLSNSRNVKVLGIVFDTSTQRIVAICTFIPD